MSLFEVHTIESAPEQSRATLEQAKKSMGMVPNLYGVLSESPAAVEAYSAVNKAFSSASLSPVEQQVVLLTVAVENGCTYCVAAHSMLAHKQGVAGHVVEAIRDETIVDDAKLDALRQFTIDVVKKRGWVDRCRAHPGVPECRFREEADLGSHRRDRTKDPQQLRQPHCRYPGGRRIRKPQVGA